MGGCGGGDPIVGGDPMDIGDPFGGGTHLALMEGGNHGEGELNMGGVVVAEDPIVGGTRGLWGTHFGDAPFWIQ